MIFSSLFKRVYICIKKKIWNEYDMLHHTKNKQKNMIQLYGEEMVWLIVVIVVVVDDTKINAL